MHLVYMIVEKQTKCMIVFKVRTYTIWNDAKTIIPECLVRSSIAIPIWKSHTEYYNFILATNAEKCTKFV